MNKEYESKLNYHEEENAMVTDLDDLKIRKKEQISEENDEDKLNQSHDEDVHSDLNNE